MYRILWLTFLALRFATVAGAQGVRFQILVGGGMNGVISRSGPVNYNTLLLPRLSAGARIPLTDNVALLTGADFQQKGFRSQETRLDTSVRTSTAANATLRYSQVNIPLQVAVRLMQNKNLDIQLNAGMSYGFMISATAAWSNSTYYPSGDRDDYGGQAKPRISLLPDASRLPAANLKSYGALYLFNPAFAGGLTLQARKHLLLQLYGEYNLYDAASVSYVPRINLYSLGACIGYRF
jgi:hypothetical protein